MKIMLPGSMSFAPKMKETKDKLEKKGFEVLVTSALDFIIENPHITNDLDTDYEHCLTNDIFRKFFDSIVESIKLLNRRCLQCVRYAAPLRPKRFSISILSNI